MEPQPFYIAATASRGDPITFTPEERARHVYIVGKSGSGKSTLLFNLAMLDILAGRGLCVIDPHGDLAEAIADSIPRRRINDVCYLNVADTERPAGLIHLPMSRPRSEITRALRLLVQANAARYCHLSPTKFKAQCSVPPVIMSDRKRLWDVKDLDKWIDSLKGEPSIADDIVARLR